MTPDKILAVAQMYSTILQAQGISPTRIDTSCSFATQTNSSLLQHALHLCVGITELAGDSGKIGKANRHLAAAQMCLSFAGLYTLDELRSHNEP
jgi:hypothetical protein